MKRKLKKNENRKPKTTATIFITKEASGGAQKIWSTKTTEQTDRNNSTRVKLLCCHCSINYCLQNKAYFCGLAVRAAVRYARKTGWLFKVFADKQQHFWQNLKLLRKIYTN